MNHLPRKLYSLAVGALLVGCADVGDAPSDFTATTGAALFEASCETAALTFRGGQTVSTLGGYVAIGPEPNCSYDTRTVSSPDTSYGSSECPQQFIAVIQGVSGRNFNFTVAPVDAPTSRAACEATTLTMAAFGHRVSGWVSLGSRFYQGAWTAFGATGFCAYNSTSSPLPGVSGTAGYDVVRAAVSAYRGGVRLRVKAGVAYGNGPC